jgi:hypothetical protein
VGTESIVFDAQDLGHPSNERLSKALQATGHRAEVINAARELRCSVCEKFGSQTPTTWPFEISHGLQSQGLHGWNHMEE